MVTADDRVSVDAVFILVPQLHMMRICHGAKSCSINTVQSTPMQRLLPAELVRTS